MLAIGGRGGLLVAASFAVATPVLAGGSTPQYSSVPANIRFSTVPGADAADWTPVGPYDSDKNYLDTNWSITTTGAFINDSASGNRFQTTVAPSFTVNRPGDRLNLGLTGGAQFSKTDGGDVSIQQLNLRGTSTFDVDRDGTLTSNAAISRSQEDRNSPDVAADIATTPIEYSGTADSTYEQKFGRLDFSLKGNLERDVYGPTTLTDGTSVDNSGDNNTQLGGTLRLGYALTPVFQVFGQAGTTRTIYDSASLNGTQYALMAGLAAHWGDELSASVSAGVGVEHFDNAALADVRATLYDANLTYKHTEALTLTGDLTSAITPPGPNGTGTAAVDYQATAGATYLINEWLDWRASIDWQNIAYAGTTSTDNNYGFGIGADYLINRQTKLSADYSFARATVTPNPQEDTQTVSLGLTFQK